MADNVPDDKPSKKRQMILDNALRIMRRKRETMDKSVLSMIKDMVTSNPALSKALGYEMDKDMPLSKKPKQEKPVAPEKVQEEMVDQGNNMEVLAKLMQLNPQGKDKVKAVIKKSTKG